MNERPFDSLRRILNEIRPPADDGVLEEVAGHLAHPSPAVCEAAVSALVRLGGVAAAGAAAARLDTDDAPTRGYALECLVRLGAASLPALRGLREAEDADLRKFAADALGGIGLEACVPLLVSSLEDPDVNVVTAAAEALAFALPRPPVVDGLTRVALSAPPWAAAAAVLTLSRMAAPAARQAVAQAVAARAEPLFRAALAAEPDADRGEPVVS